VSIERLFVRLIGLLREVGRVKPVAQTETVCSYELSVGKDVYSVRVAKL